jgi:hypothetical protein
MLCTYNAVCHYHMYYCKLHILVCQILILCIMLEKKILIFDTIRCKKKVIIALEQINILKHLRIIIINMT